MITAKRLRELHDALAIALVGALVKPVHWRLALAGALV